MVDILTVGLLIFAILLGIKHSFDADHLVAVSAMLTNSQTRRTTTLSVSWALGHMITASMLTIILYTFRESILKVFLNNLEILVPIMLIFIALFTFAWEFDLLHYHRHKHLQENMNQEKEHSHLHLHGTSKKDHGAMVGIGIIHGIASNDELLLLFTLTIGIEELSGILLGVFFFTIGVILGMVVYGLSINYPIQKWGQKRVTRIVNVTIASVSIFYAVWLLLGLEGLNVFEVIGNFI
ncbi:MAG: sulfite exporter TauE/SafE family protein [Candidatus Thorarchaeota archaeon]